MAPDPRRDVYIVVRCFSDERFDVGIVNYRTNCVTCKCTLVSDVTLLLKLITAIFSCSKLNPIICAVDQWGQKSPGRDRKARVLH